MRQFGGSPASGPSHTFKAAELRMSAHSPNVPRAWAGRRLPSIARLLPGLGGLRGGTDLPAVPARMLRGLDARSRGASGPGGREGPEGRWGAPRAGPPFAPIPAGSPRQAPKDTRLPGAAPGLLAGRARLPDDAPFSGTSAPWFLVP